MRQVTDNSARQSGRTVIFQSDSNGDRDTAASPASWDVLTAFKYIAANLVTLIDARSPQSFAHLRIPSARNIQFEHIGTSAATSLLDDLNDTSLICVYGAARASSRAAADRILHAGFKNVFYIDHGFLGWEKKGLPCVTEIDGELIQVVTNRVGLAAPVFFIS